MLGSVGGSVATKVGAGFLPESKLLKQIGFWVAISTGGLFVILGLLIIFFSRWILGPFDIVVGCVILAVELMAARLRQFEIFVTIFDYKIRGPLYILFCIPGFFSVFTIAPALGTIGAGGIYAALGYIKGEKAEMPEGSTSYEKQRDVESQQDDGKL